MSLRIHTRLLELALPEAAVERLTRYLDHTSPLPPGEARREVDLLVLRKTAAKLPVTAPEARPIERFIAALEVIEAAVRTPVAAGSERTTPSLSELEAHFAGRTPGARALTRAHREAMSALAAAPEPTVQPSDVAPAPPSALDQALDALLGSDAQLNKALIARLRTQLADGDWMREAEAAPAPPVEPLAPAQEPALGPSPEVAPAPVQQPSPASAPDAGDAAVTAAIAALEASGARLYRSAREPTVGPGAVVFSRVTEGLLEAVQRLSQRGRVPLTLVAVQAEALDTSVVERLRERGAARVVTLRPDEASTGEAIETRVLAPMREDEEAWRRATGELASRLGVAALGPELLRAVNTLRTLVLFSMRAPVLVLPLPGTSPAHRGETLEQLARACGEPNVAVYDAAKRTRLSSYLDGLADELLVIDHAERLTADNAAALRGYLFDNTIVRNGTTLTQPAAGELRVQRLVLVTSAEPAELASSALAQVLPELVGSNVVTFEELRLGQRA